MTELEERPGSEPRPAQGREPGSVGPVAPSPAALGVLSPLGHDEVTLGDGWLGRWQRTNLAATLPHVLDRVEAGEAASNLARLVGESQAPLTGMFFTDTDVTKAVEAVAWASTRLPADHPLLARAASLVALLGRVQEPDGYLNSRVQGDPAVERWADPQWGHELYTAGHLFQAAVAASRAGVLPELVDVARRLADLVVAQFGPGGATYVEGHPEVETALVELYRVTGHRPYLETAARQLELRGHGWLGEDRFGSGYFQDAVVPREAVSATGHAVRQLYLLTGMVDVAVETGDADLLSAAVRVWDDLAATKTYVTGAHGSRHRDEAIGDPYELPPDRAYAESCAAIASFHLAWRLLLATGEARFAEAMDVVLHNALAASTSVSGTEFFYSNPLHLRTGHGGEHEDAPTQRLPWFTCACCPPNIARLMASVHDFLLTRSSGSTAGEVEGLQLQLPTDAVVQTRVAGGDVELVVSADHPWDGLVTVVVTAESDEEWELSLRIPAWSRYWTAVVDGSPVALRSDDGSADARYLRLRRSWHGRHEVRLQLDMDVHLVSAHPRVDAVRGCVAVMRGPVVYALEQADLPDGVVLEDVQLRRLLGAVSAPAGVGSSAPLAPVLVEAAVTVARPGQRALYTGAPRTTTQESTVVRLLPYHRWGNRTPGAMRVWLPLAAPEA